MSLESFPLPPLEETAAPATQTIINTLQIQLQYFFFYLQDFCVCFCLCSSHWFEVINLILQYLNQNMIVWVFFTLWLLSIKTTNQTPHTHRPDEAD